MNIQISLSSCPPSYLTAPPIAEPNQKSINKIVQENESPGLSIPEHRETQWQPLTTSQNDFGLIDSVNGKCRINQEIAQIDLYYMQPRVLLM